MFFSKKIPSRNRVLLFKHFCTTFVTLPHLMVKYLLIYDYRTDDSFIWRKLWNLSWRTSNRLINSELSDHRNSFWGQWMFFERLSGKKNTRSGLWAGFPDLCDGSLQAFVMVIRITCMQKGYLVKRWDMGFVPWKELF